MRRCAKIQVRDIRNVLKGWGTMAYLDETGLSHLWSKVTGLVDSSSSSGGGAFECLYYNESGTTGTVTLYATASKVLIVTNYGTTTRMLPVGLAVDTRGRLLQNRIQYTISAQTITSTVTSVDLNLKSNSNSGSYAYTPYVMAVYKLS